MTKRKDSVALFEVINKGKLKGSDPLNVPGWIGGGAEAEAPPAAEAVESPAAAGEPAQTQEIAPEVSSPLPPVPSVPRVPHGPQEPMLSIEGGRMRVTLTPVSGGIVAGVVALILVIMFSVMFALGRQSVKPADGTATLYDKTAKKPEVAVVPKTKETPPVTSDRQQPGYSYLVIQGGIKTEKDAGAIEKFCKEHGTPCTVNTITVKNVKEYIVWSLTGFTDPAKDDAQNYARDIEKLGKQYRAAGGAYDFNQKNKGKFDPMFIPGYKE